MSNLGDVKAVLGGTVANDRGGEATINQLTDFQVPYTKAAADGMASTTTANTMFWMNPYDFSVKVVGAALAPTATLTASDTDYATITIKTDDGAASTPAVAVTWTTQASAPGTGNWAVGIKETGVLTDANCTVPAGGCLWFNIAKAGSGVAVGISHYVLKLRRV
jgi:hypothetical protein